MKLILYGHTNLILTVQCEGAKHFSMTLSVNVKTQLIKKRANTCMHILRVNL